MQKVLSYINKTEKLLGNVRFAVVIILIFAVYLAYGTFQESYFGADYANRLIYKSIPFMLVQALMFLSIYFATVQRFPYKKHYFGFYILHLGLLLIFAGSVVTYIAGVDGNITLMPNTPSKKVSIPREILSIDFKGKNYEYKLPFNSSPTQLDLDFKGLKLNNFLPFAEYITQWQPISEEAPSSEYIIANDMVAEALKFSHVPQLAMDSTKNLGPLNVHYLSADLFKCFKINNPSKLILWDLSTGECFTPESKGASPTDDLLELNFEGQDYVFKPKISPNPINFKGQDISKARLRLFSKRLFEKKPHLFLFGEHIAYYDRDLEEWIGKSFNKSSSLDLPWMGFEIKLTKHSTKEAPFEIPKYAKPLQTEETKNKNPLKAISIDYFGKEYWLTSDHALKIDHNGEPITLKLLSESIDLPFEITLNRFKMDTDPGTNNPASFESFVDTYDGRETNNHHIFMNNPLKKSAFTFYQASYFPLEGGFFGSVLSVNFDPGRWIKYLGSLLLVFGTILHFYIRRKRTKHA